ncbi:hypothetical protein HRM2_48920 [Desulforapulum autotrophicum HRM2]|uniref:Uncharacterized protein n=2 Tax=Desulforapulum autotrophicum TaxID=2296 RepID=C0QIJ6_DESAH|nr:hypothetical protein HRM2_48920 [Desulforapulum autotrophicum HRM2]
MHTLSAINPLTGHCFPLVSLIGAANHHDSLFLTPVIKLAQALGIDVKLITADQAYHDSNGSVLEKTGVYVVAPPSEKAKLPDNGCFQPIPTFHEEAQRAIDIRKKRFLAIREKRCWSSYTLAPEVTHKGHSSLPHKDGSFQHKDMAFTQKEGLWVDDVPAPGSTSRVTSDMQKSSWH